MALPAQNNYIRTYTFGSECPPGTVPDTNSSSISTSYYDAAGRPVQTVKHSFTPQRNDMANLIDYDGLGRKIREWGYIPFNEADGAYKERKKFIESPDAGDHYVDYEYEPDAYHRVTEKSAGIPPTRESTRNTVQYECRRRTICLAFHSLFPLQRPIGKKREISGRKPCMRKDHGRGRQCKLCVFRRAKPPRARTAHERRRSL